MISPFRILFFGLLSLASPWVASASAKFDFEPPQGFRPLEKHDQAVVWRSAQGAVISAHFDEADEHKNWEPGAFQKEMPGIAAARAEMMSLFGIENYKVKAFRLEPGPSGVGQILVLHGEFTSVAGHKVFYLSKEFFVAKKRIGISYQSREKLDLVRARAVLDGFKPKFGLRLPASLDAPTAVGPMIDCPEAKAAQAQSPALSNLAGVAAATEQKACEKVEESKRVQSADKYKGFTGSLKKYYDNSHAVGCVMGVGKAAWDLVKGLYELVKAGVNYGIDPQYRAAVNGGIATVVGDALSNPKAFASKVYKKFEDSIKEAWGNFWNCFNPRAQAEAVCKLLAELAPIPGAYVLGLGSKAFKVSKEAGEGLKKVSKTMFKDAKDVDDLVRKVDDPPVKAQAAALDAPEAAPVVRNDPPPVVVRNDPPPAPRPEVPEPAPAPVPRVETPAPRVETPAPRVETPAPRVETPIVRNELSSLDDIRPNQHPRIGEPDPVPAPQVQTPPPPAKAVTPRQRAERLRGLYNEKQITLVDPSPTGMKKFRAQESRVDNLTKDLLAASNLAGKEKVLQMSRQLVDEQLKLFEMAGNKGVKAVLAPEMKTYAGVVVPERWVLESAERVADQSKAAQRLYETTVRQEGVRIDPLHLKAMNAAGLHSSSLNRVVQDRPNLWRSRVDMDQTRLHEAGHAKLGDRRLRGDEVMKQSPYNGYVSALDGANLPKGFSAYKQYSHVEELVTFRKDSAVLMSRIRDAALIRKELGRSQVPDSLKEFLHQNGVLLTEVSAKGTLYRTPEALSGYIKHGRLVSHNMKNLEEAFVRRPDAVKIDYHWDHNHTVAIVTLDGKPRLRYWIPLQDQNRIGPVSRQGQPANLARANVYLKEYVSQIRQAGEKDLARGLAMRELLKKGTPEDQMLRSIERQDLLGTSVIGAGVIFAQLEDEKPSAQTQIHAQPPPAPVSEPPALQTLTPLTPPPAAALPERDRIPASPPAATGPESNPGPASDQPRNWGRQTRQDWKKYDEYKSAIEAPNKVRYDKNSPAGRQTAEILRRVGRDPDRVLRLQQAINSASAKLNGDSTGGVSVWQDGQLGSRTRGALYMMLNNPHQREELLRALREAGFQL